MKVGIIGTGNVGSALGKLWAERGHDVCFSFNRDPEQLEAAARQAALRARASTPAEAAEFGEVVVLSVPWGALREALEQAGPLDGKLLFSTVSALKPDYSGLEVGTTTSAAEEIAKLASSATVVEGLPVNASILHSSSRRFGDQSPTVFYCGDDATAKATVRTLLEDAGMEPGDAGPLVSARLVEPAGLLTAQLGSRLGVEVALKLLRR